MAVDLASPLSRIVTVLTGIAGIQQVYTGVPESPTNRVSAYVTIGRIRLGDAAVGGLARHDVEYAVTFVYRVAGAEATAETTLAAVVPAFITAMLAERRTRLNGTVVSMGLPDFSLAAEADYIVVAGQEYRRLPCLIPVVQQENY
ncbi:MAG: hypothetical protein H0V67_00265 [Geodermatophilaceae bacterium]|nr:hypothetical protein [Geodermatophilaceae bacterium]